MKLSTFATLVALGVIIFSLLGGRLNLPMPAALAELNEALSPKKKAVVKVDANESKPAVHPLDLARVRGKVLAVQNDTALVDCDVQGVISKNTAAKWNQIRLEDSYAGRSNLAALAQAEADRETFGNLMMLDAQGIPRIAEFTPQKQLRGRILLRGPPVGVGDAVHMVTAPVGKSRSGVTVYTANFAMQGGAWMWKTGNRTMLDKPHAGGGGGMLTDDVKIPPHAPPLLPSAGAK